MAENSLSPGEPEPNRGERRTSWIRRRPPEDPSDCVLFLLERMDRVYSLFIMRDLSRLFGAVRAARPSATLLRHWRKEFADAGRTAQITRHLLREVSCEAAGEPHRRRCVKKKTADNAWLRRQLGSLEPPQ